MAQEIPDLGGLQFLQMLTLISFNIFNYPIVETSKGNVKFNIAEIMSACQIYKLYYIVLIVQ